MVDTTILHSYGYLDSSIGTLLKVEHLISHYPPYHLELRVTLMDLMLFSKTASAFPKWLRTFGVMVVMIILYLLAISLGGGLVLYYPFGFFLKLTIADLATTNPTLFSSIQIIVPIIIFFLPITVISFYTNWFSILTIKSFKAKELEDKDVPNLFEIVENLVKTANLPMPKLYIYEDDNPNAFATGRNPENSAIVINTELLNQLDKRQLTGVLAHELAHIKNRDTLTNVVAMQLMRLMIIIPAGMASITAICGTLLSTHDRNKCYLYATFCAILSTFLGFLGKVFFMSLSRNREFIADRTGAEISGDPLGLASALETLADISQNVETNKPAYTSHLFIHNPINHKHFLKRFFSTHPSIERRIARLKSMADS